jgi:hypothetical protein
MMTDPVIHHLTEDKTYTFHLDETQPVVSKGGSIYEYVFECSEDHCGAIVRVLMHHNTVTGQPDEVDTVNISGVDYIPIVCKLSRKVTSMPTKIFFTPRGDDSSFHTYDLDVR